MDCFLNDTAFYCDPDQQLLLSISAYLSAPQLF